MTCKFLNFALAGYVIATSAVQAADGTSSELWVGIRLSGWTQLITRGQGHSYSKRQDEDTSDENWLGMRSWELNSEAVSWAAILQNLAEEAAWSSFYSSVAHTWEMVSSITGLWYLALPCGWLLCFFSSIQGLGTSVSHHAGLWALSFSFISSFPCLLRSCVRPFIIISQDA